MKCFYHRADMDGKCSGALVKMEHPDCEMIGINYGDSFPWETVKPNEDVYMVDFSLQPFEDMERLNAMCNLIWVDHHITAIEESKKRGFRAYIQSLDTNYAGCELTWSLLHPVDPFAPLIKKVAPHFVWLLGRYDVWDHSIPEILEFQSGLRSYGPMYPDDPTWKMLFEDSFVDQVIEIGKIIIKHEKGQNEAYAKSCAYDVLFDSLRCVAINKGLANSLLFASVYDPAKHDAMLCYVWRKDKWTVSLYSSKPEVDVSVVCKARGGGGHKGAAGFQCQELPF